MVNILILGAASPTSQTLYKSLPRSGNHCVYCLAQTPERARPLGVISIPGDLFNNAKIQEGIEAHSINVVVGVVGALAFPLQALLAELKRLGRARLATASDAGKEITKLGFIYCSGIGVTRDSNKPDEDIFPIGLPNSRKPPAQRISWLPKFEQDVVDVSDVLAVMVMRSALVYGYAHPNWSRFFKPISKAVRSGATSVSLPAEPHSRPGLVHAIDVASGLHAAIDKLASVSRNHLYPVFDLVTSQESMRDISESAAKELGFKGKVKLVGVGDDRMAKAMCTSINGSSARARLILGWEPKKIGFVQGMDIYAKAHAASRSYQLTFLSWLLA
ncbi:uncharacterized protein BP5553_01738 [Venustampulla echinocandica]|uniref:Uncharacterized protein n=1 Tax=Venustampulla echinocandica TaxID=2656787 RepID=A0A370U1U5_9HELO|nr:uncharacterized protein BP5553_01738 [Venustampulla echinocandica]RDL41759.1 hypothetical protein BP5553_01738 [Venustampulla echinocandica]